jgi:hypothetical protein
MQRLSLLSGTLANRPTPETVNATWGGAGFGLLYFSTDTSQIFQWNGAAWTDITSSFVPQKYKFEGSNVVSVTVGNTGVQTNLQTIPIAANEIGVGQTFYVDCQGIIGAAAGANLTLYTFLDAAILGSNIFNPGTVNTQPWSLRTFFTGLVAGVGGSVSGAVTLFQSTNSFGNVTTGAVGVGQPARTVAIDTTIPHTLKLAATWNPGAVANTITQDLMTCYRTG